MSFRSPMESNTAVENIERPEDKVFAVGVEFRQAGRVYTFVTQDGTISRGERVVVETEGGPAVGTVITGPAEAKEGGLPPDVKKVIRRATGEDIEKENSRRDRAVEYFAICRDKIREKNLPMKLVDTAIEEDGRKAVFVFFAEQRVDFRSLVKELAVLLHLRIEMRQVGARDESKYKGCMGPCGLMTCCSQHLREFEPISISMAKHQGLAPNPAKLTGMCGKLRCCLAYEEGVYNEYRKDLPKVGVAVSSPKGAGKIIGHNVLKRECTIKLYSGGEARCACDACKFLTPEERQAAIEAAKKAEESGEERGRRGYTRPGGRGERNRRFENRGQRPAAKEQKFSSKPKTQG